MAGTVSGGKQAAKTNRDKYGQDFYSRLGRLGGRKGRTGGFAAGEEGRERARKFGAVGGAVSRRGVSRKLTKAEAEHIRRKLLQEQSEMQRSRLNAKYGSMRPW